nr:Fic family protein [Desulfobulbus elongatus]
MAGQDLYPSVEERAAHLLYFVIKDHPFSDGNKRIGSFLFLLYLQENSLIEAVRFDNKEQGAGRPGSAGCRLRSLPEGSACPVDRQSAGRNNKSGRRWVHG